MRISYLSNFVPEEIADVSRFLGYPESDRMLHFCPYVAEALSALAEDKHLDGLVAPFTCDSSSVIVDYSRSQTGKFVHHIRPPTHDSEGAMHYFAAELRRYHTAVSSFTGVTFEEDEITERSEHLVRRRAAIRNAYVSLEDTSYHAYLERIHQVLALPISEAPDLDFSGLPAPRGTKRIYVVGPFLYDLSVLEVLEHAGGLVVGDDLGNSKRYAFSTHKPDITARATVFERIAAETMSRSPSATSSRFSEIIDTLLSEVLRKRVRGVIFVLPAFCEPYEFLYAAVKPLLTEQGVKCQRAQLASTQPHSADLRIRLSSFVESL